MLTKLEMIKKLVGLINQWGGYTWSWNKEEADQIRKFLRKMEEDYKESDKYTKELIRIKESEIEYMEKDLEELKRKLNAKL
jgi:hypothetical protein